MADASFSIVVDNSDKIRADLELRIEASLEACGAIAVSHTVNNLTRDAYKHEVSWYRRTGHLKDFSHLVKMDEKAVYVGTNVPYAA